MDAFNILHNDLNVIDPQIPNKVLNKNKTEDLINANKSVWDIWWQKKFKNN